MAFAQFYGVNALCHPGIAQIHAVGALDGGTSYVALELLDGVDLREPLMRETRLDLRLLPPLFEQLCHALNAVHDAGLIHGRLCPASIVVLRSPPYPTARIRGFDDDGIEAATPPVYAAPELNRAGDRRARHGLLRRGSHPRRVRTRRQPACPSDGRARDQDRRRAPPRRLDHPGEPVPQDPAGRGQRRRAADGRRGDGL